MDRRKFITWAALMATGAAAPGVTAAIEVPVKVARAAYGRRVFGWIEVGSHQVTTLQLRLPVPAERLGLYRSLLPPQLDLPAVPRIYFYLTKILGTYPVKIEGGYFEAAVCIRASFKGDRKTDRDKGGWHVLTMPVSDRAALDAGLMMGYPKYLADIEVSTDTDGANGMARAEGREVFRLEWKPAMVEVPAMEEEDLKVPYYVVRDGLVNIMETEVRKQKNLDIRTGFSTVVVNASAPWAGLLDGFEVKGPAALKVATGKFNLTRRSK